jgi:two-component system, response regulator, stage 0 sporulation protein F
MHRILMVDDDRAILMLYHDELTEEGYDVLTCRKPSQIMDAIAQNRPDLLLMEIRLTSHNGLDLLQDVKNRFPELPVVLYTASPAYEYDVKSVAADDFYVKSSNLEGLKRKIDEIMYRNQGSIRGEYSPVSPDMRTSMIQRRINDLMPEPAQQ